MDVQVPQRKSLLSPLVITAVILGTIQGLFWLLLSLLFIIFYTKHILPGDGYPDNVGVEVGPTIYFYYLDKDNLNNDPILEAFGIHLIIGPKQFNYFMYLYFPLSVFLFVGSIKILCVAITGKGEKYFKCRIWSWIINIILLSLLDLILMSLIAHDYGQVKKEEILSPDMDMLAVMLLSVRIVMSLAARGYVVWIINVIFVIILGKHILKKETTPYQPLLGTSNTGESTGYHNYGTQVR